MAVALLLASVIGWPATAGAGAGDAQPPPVATAIVTVRPLSGEATFSGVLEPSDRVEIRAAADGQVRQRSFTDGSVVKAGQVLFRLDDARAQAALALARAKLARAEAERQSAHSAVDRAPAADAAALDKARAKEREAEAEVAVRRAGVRDAELDLAACTITAPVGGNIGLARAAPGDWIGPRGDPLAVITAIDPVFVRFSATATHALALPHGSAALSKNGATAGPAVRLVRADGTPWPQAGVVDYVGAALDPDSGRLPLRARFSNEDGRLLPGEAVTITVAGWPAEKVPAIPEGALRFDGRGSFVYVVNPGGRIEKRPITVAAAQADFRPVITGLAAGETVVADPTADPAVGAVIAVRP